MDMEQNSSEHAKELARLGASKGGAARAKALTPEQRQEIARAAVTARWRKAGKAVKPLPRATHEGDLPIENMRIPCAVLDDGRRLLTQQGVLLAIGRARAAKGGQGASIDNAIPFLAAQNLKPFISQELLLSTTPINFITKGGRLAFGFPAEILPEVCDVFLEARKQESLLPSQEHIATQCEILVRGFARVGIIALVDEATGFQDARARDALARILEAFIAKELRKWVRTFPPEFYKELFRLRNLPYPPDQVKKPRFIGRDTNDLVYARLAPGVLKELQTKNPRNEHGNRSARHHQWLSVDIGHPKLREHLASVITLMRVSQKWSQFKEMLDKALPVYQDVPLFEALPDNA